MRLLLPLMFLSVPLIEIALFIAIGGRIGVVPTMALVVATALLGTVLLRRQGFAVLATLRRDLDQGRVPLAAIGDGLFLLAAGLLLLTPGFFTDTVGFLLFVPAIRAALGRFALQLVADGKIDAMQQGMGRGGETSRGGTTIIEGEVIERHDAPPAQGGRPPR